ncbi:MAG: mycofactocin biosynthesis peptidyl-dipeptidase MftE [Pseudonocardiaceae bacterium]|nr:mycofactocin biosynthesis peptidyl-dipeptidase MftE [Pseudonocardiaceae bacterium]
MAQHRWPELDGAGPTLLVPVGSLEQHGPHLPLDTDSRIAQAVAGAAAAPGALLAPPVAYGASGEHETFPGTVSIGHEALYALLVELGRSACRWASRVVLVNGHGGNAGPVRDGVTLLRAEGRDAAWFACAVPGADAHAGRTETSLLLALDAGAVDSDAARPGNIVPLGKLMPAIRSGSVRVVSGNGVLGDPAGASAEEGGRLLAHLVETLRDRVQRWDPGPDGQLR